MFGKIKEFFNQNNSRTVASEAAFARNRFVWLDVESSPQKGIRRFVNEAGYYAENGTITELEFADSPVEFDFLMTFKNKEEKQFRDLLASLNDLDNLIQDILEKRSQQIMPKHMKELGYTPERWKKTFHFHPWILSCDEEPPSLRYVADYVNNEFTVYLAQSEGVWQVYWNRACTDLVR